jgi:hypothetical protein
MNYEVYGPFSVPRTKSVLDRSRLGELWQEAEGQWEGLSSATGIFVYSSRHGDSFTPWYVGMTTANTGFRGEVFQDHKVSHYLASAEFKRGPAVLHLIPRVDPRRGTFSRPSAAARRDIDMLETVIIGMALRANPSLRNGKKTWFNKNCFVPGVTGPASAGRRPTAPATPRSALRLDG